MSNSSKYAPRYFSIDFNVADEGWKHLLSIKDAENAIYNDNVFYNIGAHYKSKGLITFITSYPFTPVQLEDKTSFSYIPFYIDNIYASEVGIKGGFFTFEDIITKMPTILRVALEKEITLSMKGITEITEEEFYKME